LDDRPPNCAAKDDNKLRQPTRSRIRSVGELYRSDTPSTIKQSEHDSGEIVFSSPSVVRGIRALAKAYRHIGYK